MAGTNARVAADEDARRVRRSIVRVETRGVDWVEMMWEEDEVRGGYARG